MRKDIGVSISWRLFHAMEYFHNRKYRTIARRLIRTLPHLRFIQEEHIRIAYASCCKEKMSSRRRVYGECIKVPDQYRWIVPYDFLIVIYEPNVVHMTDDQIRILLLHELQHIGIDYSGEEPKLYVAPHDIEDFRNILEAYGLDWSE